MPAWSLGVLLTGLLAVFGPTAAGAQHFDERLPLCLDCHGEQGQSPTPETPSLGGQPPMYLMIELYMFRQNLRVAPPMNDMAKGLTDAELQKFADTMAKLPPPAAEAGGEAPRLQRAATLVAQHRCAFCHGANLAGSENVPRLAGQREDYLLKALREYKGQTRAEYQPVMAEVIVPLKDEDFVDLAHYLAHYRGP